MAIFRIRQLDDSLMSQLRQRAARNNRSVEEEAQAILENALVDKEVTENQLTE